MIKTATAQIPFIIFAWPQYSVMVRYLIAFLTILVTLTSFGQTFSGREATSKVPGAKELYMAETGEIRYVSFFDSSSPKIDRENHSPFLIGLFDLPEGHSFHLKKESSDKLGFLHVKLEQRYHNLKVEGALVTVHSKDGRVNSVSGAYLKRIDLPDAKPRLSLEDAIEISKEHVRAESYREAEIEDHELLIYDNKGSSHLARKIRVESINPFGKKDVYVDAHTGKVLFVNDLICNSSEIGTAETRYSGDREIVTELSEAGSYSLEDYTRGQGIITKDLNGDFTPLFAQPIQNQENYWYNTFYGADGALDAHWGMEIVYDYFSDEHGRNSFDNQGALITSFVDYGINFENAFWDGEHFYFGSGSENVNGFTSLDIVGHEFTHAVIDYSAQLHNGASQKALAESYCDIFGVIVDYYTRPDQANFQMGEEVDGMNYRDLSDPHSRNHPKTYQGLYWSYNSLVSPHINCGVQNYWFHLLVNGEAGFSEDGYAYDIESIGMDAASEIVWRTLTVYMHPYVDYYDARYYSIQAAVDLYGHCSPEEIAVTNAWFAVGVGGPFDSDLEAYFDAANTSSCSVPAGIQFAYASQNATSFLWDFGDGNTSIEESPYHIYEETGTYDVTLTVTGEGECAGNAQQVAEDFIEVMDEGGPASPSCISPGMYAFGYTLSEFNFGETTLPGGSQRYIDLTCESDLALTEGLEYDVFVSSQFTVGNFYVRSWIDFNGDGLLTNDETIFYEHSQASDLDTNLIIPYGIVYNAPLLMRLVLSLQPIENSCPAAYHGQMIDYRATVLPTSMVPEADFTAETPVIHVGETVQFQDLTLHAPNEWLWSFPGGDADDITTQNPSVVYDQPGFYDVTLMASNANGSSEIVKQEYVEVRSNFIMCEDQTTSSMFGVLYDSGGPDANYGNNEDCSFLISPECADVITLTFEEFDMEWNFDKLRIYDGVDSTAEEIQVLFGDNMPDPVVAHSGHMFLEFTTDFSYTDPGWVATWEAVELEEEAEVAFEMSTDLELVNQEVQFTELCDDNVSEWSWDFGDGTFSTEPNPTHVYTESGTYQVSLQAGHCYDSDIFVDEITIINPAAIEISHPDTLVVNLECGESENIEFTVYNVGETNLDLELGVASQSIYQDFNVLYFGHATSTSDYWQLMPNLIEQIPGANLETYNANMDSEYLNVILDNTDLMVVEDVSLGNYDEPFFFDAFSSYLINGGKVIMRGVYLPAEFGLFDQGSTNGVDSIHFEVPDHPILDGISLDDPFKIGTVQGLDYTGVDVLMSLVFQNQNHPSAFIKTIGQGKLVCLPLAGYNSSPDPMFDNNQIQIIKNSIQYLVSDVAPGLSSSTELGSSSVLLPGDSLQVNILVDASDYPLGTHFVDFPILSNDLFLDSLGYVIQVNIAGGPELETDVDELNFADAFPGQTYSQDIVLSNEGCDTLFIEPSLVHPEFEIESNINYIAPYSSDTLNVQYTPYEIGTDSAGLLLTSELEILEIALVGNTLSPPELEILSPDTIVIPALCGTSGSFDVQIANNGQSDLTLSIEAPLVNSPLKVIFVESQYPASLEYYNIKAPFENSPIALNIQEYNTSTEYFELLSELENTDVLVLPNHVPSSQATANLSSAFLENGGQLLINSSSSLAYYDFLLLESLTFSDSDTLYYHNELDNNALMEGVPQYFQSAAGMRGIISPSLGNSTTYCTRGGAKTVSSYNVGDGTAYWFGFYRNETTYWDSFIYERIMNRMFESAWNANGASGQVDTLTSVQPGETFTITLDFDVMEIYAGSYYKTISIESNDPENPVTTIVYEIQVLDHTILALDENEVIFEDQFAGVPSVRDVIIRNDGCETMLVNTSINGAGFEIVEAPMDVMPFSQDTVRVEFLPEDAEIYNADLIIQSESEEASVSLSGLGISPPIMSLSSGDTISVSADCMQNIPASFTIYNTGGFDLIVEPHNSIYDFVVSSSWTVQETISAGDSLEVNLILDLEDEDAGTYYFDLPLLSNDPFWMGGITFQAQVINENPEILIDQTEIDFGEVSLNNSETVIVSLENSTCGDVPILISVDDENFSLNWESWDAYPYTDYDLQLTFAPFTVGTFNATMIVETSAGNFQIPIFGEGVENSMSVQDLQDADFVVYPNPSAGDFVIDCTGQLKIRELVILNAIGQEVSFEHAITQAGLIKINMENPAPGLYILKCADSTGRKWQSRIVILQ